MLHALAARGECRLLAVTLTKDHPAAAALVDAITTFYGQGEIPIGVCQGGPTAESGSFLSLAATGGRRRLLVLDDAQQAGVLEAFQLLCSQPSAPRADRRVQKP